MRIIYNWFFQRSKSSFVPSDNLTGKNLTGENRNYFILLSRILQACFDRFGGGSTVVAHAGGIQCLLKNPSDALEMPNG